MKEVLAVAVRAAVFLTVADERNDRLDELTTRMKREMEHGRGHCVHPLLLLAVTVEMAAFYREHPDHN